VKIDTDELSIVVEHFFKMRDKPNIVDSIPVKTAPELVIDAPACHLVAGMAYDL
jgi:hypothetical protein